MACQEVVGSPYTPPPRAQRKRNNFGWVAHGGRAFARGLPAISALLGNEAESKRQPDAESGFVFIRFVSAGLKFGLWTLALNPRFPFAFT